MNIYKTDIDPEDNSILFYEKVDINTVHEETTMPLHTLNNYFIDFGVLSVGTYCYINIEHKDRLNIVESLLKLIRDTSINKLLS